MIGYDTHKYLVSQDLKFNNKTVIALSHQLTMSLWNKYVDNALDFHLIMKILFNHVN